LFSKEEYQSFIAGHRGGRIKEKSIENGIKEVPLAVNII